MSRKLFTHNILGVFKDKLSFFNPKVTAEESIEATKEFITSIYSFNYSEPSYPTNFVFLAWNMFSGLIKHSGKAVKTAGKCLVSRKHWMLVGSWCGFFLFEIMRLAAYVPLGIAIGSTWGSIALVSNLVIGIPAYFKKCHKELCGKNLTIKILSWIFVVPVGFAPSVVFGSLAAFFISNYVAIRGVRDVLVASKELGSTRLEAMKEGVIIMVNGFLDTAGFALTLLKE